MTLMSGDLVGQRRSGDARWRLRQKAKAATHWLIDVVQAVLLAWAPAAIFNLAVEEKEKEDGEADD